MTKQISEYFSGFGKKYYDYANIKLEKKIISYSVWKKEIPLVINNYSLAYDENYEVRYFTTMRINYIQYNLPKIGDLFDSLSVKLYIGNEDVTDLYLNAVEFGFQVKNFYRASKYEIDYFKYPHNFPHSKEKNILTVFLNENIPNGEYNIVVDMMFGHLHKTDLKKLWEKDNVWKVRDFITMTKDEIFLNYP